MTPSVSPFRAAPFRIGLVQMAMADAPAENAARASAFIETAARGGARVVCLPEMFTSKYFCQVESTGYMDLAEPLDGPSLTTIRETAKRLGVLVVAPFFERRAPGLYHNSAALVAADGSVQGLYRKTHIPDDPAYYEKFYFTPGDLGFQSFPTPYGRLGVLICWDQWYPEAARLTAMTGASVIFYPTAIGWHPSEKKECGPEQLDAWRTVQRGHAVANGLYVAAANRVGHETPPEGGAGIEFWGHSFVADPQGKLIATADHQDETVVFAEIDPARIEDVRRNWPFFRDRRIDLFGDLQKRWLDDGQGASK